MRIRVTSKASSRVVLSIQLWPLQLIAVVISGRQLFILWLVSFPHLSEFRPTDIRPRLSKNFLVG